MLTLPSNFLQMIRAIVGEAHAIAPGADQKPFLTEWRDRYQGQTPLVIRPGTTQELSKVAALCHEHRVPMTPQGGNTGLVGGQIPFGDSVLINLSRMNRIRALDPVNNTVTAEAGVILATLQDKARDAERLYPVSLASEGSCQIGGTLSSNAGGINVLRYGTAREQVLGLEVVLADGRIWDGLKGLRKDNTGYDLKALFLGAEGTLGFITAAVIKLYPLPAETLTGFAAVPSVEAATALLTRAQAASGNLVSSFELMPRIGLEFVLRHGNALRDPLAAPSPWYVLMDWEAGSPDQLRAPLETSLEGALTAGEVSDAVIAESAPQADALWALREFLSEAQKPEGGSIKHDVSVPISHYAAFIEEASKKAEAMCPGIRPVPFGHLGDGNVHFNLSQPTGMDKQAFLARWEEISDAIHEIAARHGGSISAEHGIGIMKRGALPRFKSAVEMDLMRSIKDALDPLGLMNPGKLL